MTTPGRRLAVNPIPYWAKAGKTREVFEEAFADFAKIGYSAVKADVPDGMEAQEYLDWIGSYGLAPAISLFSSPLDETIDITEEVERAKRFAGTQAALGLDRTMISSMAIPARMAQPAVGADFSRDRLNLAIENCGIICQVLQSEGLRPLHHSHVGGVFETEEEIVTLLDELGPDLIGIGPDTGHLRWAGIEPASLIERYAGRLGGIHIKDVFPDHLSRRDGTGEAPGGASYQELAATKRLWCEPGRGVVDFEAMLKALPEDYDGDFMIEIDEPSVDSRFESHQIAYQWAQLNLPVSRG
jgi:inosose dehydratase